MTSNEIASIIGRSGMLKIRDKRYPLSIPIRVVEVVKQFGKLRYQCEVVGGVAGERSFFDATTITLDNDLNEIPAKMNQNI